VSKVDRETTAKGGSTRTVVVAVLANFAIALAKGAAAAVTGSAALWAETLHSFADMGNQLLLFVGLRRSARPPDATHPYGYGQERFFWSFLAALGIFLIGGLLSIGEGVRSLLRPEPLESPWIGIGVLVVAAGFEAYSWLTAHRQLRTEASRTGRTLAEHVRRTSDPSAPTVYLEDSAALLGLALALVALVLHMLTGWHGWDAYASIAIGVLLIGVAWLLARRAKALLIDQSAPPDVVEPLRAMVEDQSWVRKVHRFDAVYVGPSRVLLTTWLDPAAELRAGPAGDLIARIEDLRDRLMAQPHLERVVITIVEPRDP